MVQVTLQCMIFLRMHSKGICGKLDKQTSSFLLFLCKEFVFELMTLFWLYQMDKKTSEKIWMQVMEN